MNDPKYEATELTDDIGEMFIDEEMEEARELERSMWGHIRS